MTSKTASAESPARRIEDQLPDPMREALLRLAKISDWTVRELMLALLANGITHQAILHTDRELMALAGQCNRELMGTELRRRQGEFVPLAGQEGAFNEPTK